MKLAVAIDFEYVYAGLQGAASRWRDNGWVSATGPVANVHLWQQLLETIQSSCTIFQWVKIPRHVGLHGNNVVDYTSHVDPPPLPVGVAVCTPTPPRREIPCNHALTLSSRNLFRPGRAGPMCDDQDCAPPQIQPQALFLDEVSSYEQMTHKTSSCVSLPRGHARSSFRSSDRHSADSAATATTVSQAWSSSDSESESNNYIEACRLLAVTHGAASQV